MVVNIQLQIQHAKSVPMTSIPALSALTEERFFFDGTVYLGGSLSGSTSSVHISSLTVVCLFMSPLILYLAYT